MPNPYVEQVDVGGTSYDIHDAGVRADIANKQDKTDNSLSTTNKTVVGAINEHEDDITAISGELSIKRAEVSATQATIGTKIQQFYQALSVATDLQLRHAVIIRYGLNYNYVYRIESKQNSVYQFCSQQQNGDKNIVLRTLNIKTSGSTAWLFTVSGASANTLTEQTTANDSSVWELYY